jgi:hypothetical protein
MPCRDGVSPCVCPTGLGRGDVVVVASEGLEGRWRVMKAEAHVLIIARAGRVEALYGDEVTLARRAS